MVVLAVSVLTRSGKALVSRQYVDMTRIRVEGLLAAFPKLISEDSGNQKRQHTYVETDSVRYVFQPIEELYLVLITTKGSNIVQDLSTLQLVSKILPETCQNQPISEESISEKVFELVFAFDEVLTMGYREDITIQEIRRNLEMESHEEKLHDMLRESKEADAREEMRRKVAAIKAAQRENIDLGGIEGKPANSYGGDIFAESGFDSYQPPTETREDFKTFSFDKNQTTDDTDTKSRLKLGKGMSLRSKKKKNEDVMNELANEEGIDSSLFERQKSANASQNYSQPIVKKEPVEVESVEVINISILADGSVKNYDVRGSMNVECSSEASNVQIHLKNDHKSTIYGENFKLTSSPKLSKQDFSNNVLKLRNNKTFPSGSRFSLLSWKMKSSNEDLLPIKIIFWPEMNDNIVNVSIELELNDELKNAVGLSDVLIKIPLGRSGSSGESFEVLSIENGVYRYNSRKNEVEWEISLLNETNPTGLLEFNGQIADTQDLFPVKVSFTAKQTLLDISVEKVVDLSSTESVKFNETKRIEVDAFEVLKDE